MILCLHYTMIVYEWADHLELSVNTLWKCAKEAIPLLADILSSSKGSLKGRIPCNLSDRATERRGRGSVMHLRYLDNKTPFAAAPDFIG